MISRNGVLRSLVALAVLFAGMAIAPETLAKKKNAKTTFFDSIPKADSAVLDRGRELLRSLDTDCPNVTQKCPAAEELLDTVAADLNYDNIPILVVYLNDRLEVEANRLIWRNKVTPYVWGVQNVWVVVLAEEPVNLKAELVNLWAQSKGIAQGFRDVFISSGRRTKEEREARGEGKPIIFEPLGEAGVDDDLWIGRQRFYVDSDASYSITIYAADEHAYQTVQFEMIEARFSNSNERRVAFGIGLGFTGDLTAEEPDGDNDISGIRTENGLISGYWLFDIYLKRPVLLKPIARTRGRKYRVSYGLALGINLDIFNADQFVLGVSIGHLFGRHGVVVGVNFIDAFASVQDSEVKPFAGINFSF